MAEASYPEDLLYHPEHDWARVDGDQATFGITWYAQDLLGEVVFLEPPPPEMPEAVRPRLSSISNASVEAERRLRSAPVLGRSNVQKSKGRENLNARALMETAAPEDGRTPPPSLRHYYSH